jgi:CcmD family protein
MIKALRYTFFLILFSSQVVYGQSGTDWLENTMFQSGKINVVVAVVAILIIILFVYLFSIDRKLKKIEEENN